MEIQTFRKLREGAYLLNETVMVSDIEEILENGIFTGKISFALDFDETVITPEDAHRLAEKLILGAFQH